MIRSCRIPSVLRRICTDGIIQTAMLVSSDGELLGSTASTFVSPDGTTRESIESLGTLIADIAVDYGKLGEEYANLDPPGFASVGQQVATSGGGITPVESMSANSSVSSAKSPQQQQQSQQQQQQQQLASSKPKSHLQCLLLELELGLVAVSFCVGVDCMVIAIAEPNAPLGTVKARLLAITAHVQESLSPLAMSAEPSHPSYRR